MSVTEAELKAIAVAPRVTLEDVHEAIKSEEYLYTDTLTFCVLTLQNGYKLTGESACASPANYNKEIGDRLAKENAVKKIWGYLGYELREKLSLIEKVGPPTGMICTIGTPHTYVGTKVVHAIAMDKKDYCQLRGWMVPPNEDPDDLGFLVQYTDSDSNVGGFDGYISWSPRDVFERAYSTEVRQEPVSFYDQLLDDMMQLSHKARKLGGFLGSAGFDKCSKEEQADLKKQHVVMLSYLEILNRRIDRHSY